MLNHVESPSLKKASFSCHVKSVEYVECFGNYEGPFFWGGGVSPKCFNIFNMTAERSTFLEEGGSTYSTYST